MEYDRLSPLAEQSAIQSMASSKYQILRRWSTPTSPHYGIHKLFEQSDQRLWTHKCPHCGYCQVLDYDNNIKLLNKDGIDTIGKKVYPGTFQYVCQKCGKPLDRWYDGFWDITSPGDGGRAHGYSLSQMDCVWISADSLKQSEMNAPSKSYFYNYSLGRPYQDDSLAFKSADVYSHIADYDRPFDRSNYTLVSAGLDWGENEHHIVIMGMTESGRIDLMHLKSVPRALGAEHIEEDLDMVVRTLNQFAPDIIIADRGLNISSTIE